jgi:hypothetical protein
MEEYKDNSKFKINNKPKELDDKNKLRKTRKDKERTRDIGRTANRDIKRLIYI